MHVRATPRRRPVRVEPHPCIGRVHDPEQAAFGRGLAAPDAGRVGGTSRPFGCLRLLGHDLVDRLDRGFLRRELLDRFVGRHLFGDLDLELGLGVGGRLGDLLGGGATGAAAGALASSATWVSDLMSMRQPVSRAASRAFWPSFPIASDSW